MALLNPDHYLSLKKLFSRNCQDNNVFIYIREEEGSLVDRVLVNSKQEDMESVLLVKMVVYLMDARETVVVVAVGDMIVERKTK